MSHLYIGVDVGKSSHVAAFLSRGLLAQKKSFVKCPTKKIANSRADFEQLLKSIPDPSSAHLLVERTGHYTTALEQFCNEHGIHVYRMQANKRYGKNKTDLHDARALALMLYNQIELGVEHADEAMRIRPLVAPSPVARELRGLVRHRYELTRETVQRQNKLTAICDELFPEFTAVCADPNTASALAIREAFPTPQAVAAATIDELCAARVQSKRPSREALVRLRELAVTSIGVRDVHRIASLVMEQRQLIAEIRMLREHTDELETRIAEIVSESREGRILTSFIGIGPVQAATIISAIGSIANFETSGRFKGYLGWAPRQTQTGTTIDSTTLAKSGNSLLKQTVYLITLSAIHYDPTWKHLYDRLVARMCAWDEKKQKYRGRMKVIGHVAGQLCKVMYRLLRADYELVASWDGPADSLPEPILYDPERHQVKGAGGRPHHIASAS